MIKVCDAIMGTGKSSAAITYMNEHQDQKFIYITPYLEEANRIKKGCPKLRFIEPSDKLEQYHFKKTEHTAALIKQGRNITTTHQAFKRYTQDTLDDIKHFGYTLIIDENIEMLERYDIHEDDIELLIQTGYIEDNDGIYSVKNPDYNGKMFQGLFKCLQSRELIKLHEGNDNHSLFYWVLPPELLTSFQDVFILTYLFHGQSIRYFMDVCNLEYEYIGIEKESDGTFRFGEYPGYTPEYVSSLKDMIHILDKPKLNSIGDDYHALSKHWFEKGEGNDELKNHIANFFRNIHGDIPASQKLWGTYKDAEVAMRGKGYTKSFLTFNAKSTNAYRDRVCLAYLTNTFMNVNEKKFYNKHGLTVDEDTYALSIMVQWIWRSAIRDGGEVYLYIPSRRMRTLLMNWIEEISKGGNNAYEKAM